MSKRHKGQKPPERPPDNLPPGELQKQWDEFLDYHVGTTGTSPRWELIISPDHLEKYLGYVMSAQKTDEIQTDKKMQLFMVAIHEAVNKLPFTQRMAIKNYYGIERGDRLTQAQIAEEYGVSQKTISKSLKSARENLKKWVRAEMVRLVVQEIQNSDLDDMADSDSGR